jgi:hypothetical protein
MAQNGGRQMGDKLLRKAFRITAACVVMVALLPILKWAQISVGESTLRPAADLAFAIYLFVIGVGAPVFVTLRLNSVRSFFPYPAAGAASLSFAVMAFLYSMHVADGIPLGTAAPGLCDFATILPTLIRVTFAGWRSLVEILGIGGVLGIAYWLLYVRRTTKHA